MSHASWGQRARLESQNSPCHATGSQSSSQHQKPRCTQAGCNLSEGWPGYSGCCPPWSLLCLLVQQDFSLCSFFSLKEGPFHLHPSDSARDHIFWSQPDLVGTGVPVGWGQENWNELCLGTCFARTWDACWDGAVQSLIQAGAQPPKTRRWWGWGLEAIQVDALIYVLGFCVNGMCLVGPALSLSSGVSEERTACFSFDFLCPWEAFYMPLPLYRAVTAFFCHTPLSRFMFPSKTLK